MLVAPVRPAIPVFCPLTLGLTATSVPRIPANKQYQMKTCPLSPLSHVKIWINCYRTNKRGICITCLCWNRAVYVLLLSPGSNTCKSGSCETWSQRANWAPSIFCLLQKFYFSATCVPVLLPGLATGPALRPPRFRTLGWKRVKEFKVHADVTKFWNWHGHWSRWLGVGYTSLLAIGERFRIYFDFSSSLSLLSKNTEGWT